jgi:hypothetical protein
MPDARAVDDAEQEQQRQRQHRLEDEPVPKAAADLPPQIFQRTWRTWRTWKA